MPDMEMIPIDHQPTFREFASETSLGTSWSWDCTCSAGDAYCWGSKEAVVTQWLDHVARHALSAAGLDGEFYVADVEVACVE